MPPKRMRYFEMTDDQARVFPRKQEDYMKLHFTNDWLRRTTAADPDVDIEAGPAIDSAGGHLWLAHAR